MKASFLVLLLILLTSISTTELWAQSPTPLTAEEIINKHVAAVGGKEAIARLKSRIALGTIKKEDEPDGQMAVMSESPNRLSVFYQFRDYDMRMIYDGTNATMRPVLAAKYRDFGDKYLEIISSGLMFNSISLYNLIANGTADGLKLEANGLKKVGGKQAYVVQLKPQKSSMKLYFDAETFMWVRTDYGSVLVSAGLREVAGDTNRLNQVNPQGASETTVDFYIETSDFRDVDGVKLPFKFTQLITSPILRKKAVGTITGTIREYKHNELIDPKMFQ